MFQYRNVAQQARKLEHEFLRLLTQHREPRHWKALVERGEFFGQSGFAQHDT